MFGYMLASKTRDVLLDCDCVIKMRTNPNGFTADDAIQGDVIVTTHAKIDFRSLWIRLEGVATARFQRKIDNRLTNHLKTDRFLPDETTQDEGSLCVYLIGKKPEARNPSTEKITLQKGNYSYPFEFKLSSALSFPATFQSSFGRIQYKLVLYACSLRETYWHDTTPAERVLKTNGHLNLLADPALSKPLVVERKREKSFFSKRNLLKVNLYLDKSGYLPGEQLTCKLQVENPGCDEISKLQLSFVQKILYFDNKVSKNTVAKLEDQEHACETCDGEIQWEFSMVVPTNLMPTFMRDKRAVEILYFLEFTVRVAAGKVGLKGEAPIVIGTEARCVQDDTVDSAGAGMLASDRPTSSDSTTWDAQSVQSSSNFPPDYSNLSSRRPSLETLPPTYDTVVGDDNWDDAKPLPPDFMPRSSSSQL